MGGGRVVVDCGRGLWIVKEKEKETERLATAPVTAVASNSCEEGGDACPGQLSSATTAETSNFFHVPLKKNRALPTRHAPIQRRYPSSSLNPRVVLVHLLGFFLLKSLLADSSSLSHLSTVFPFFSYYFFLSRSPHVSACPLPETLGHASSKSTSPLRGPSSSLTILDARWFIVFPSLRIPPLVSWCIASLGLLTFIFLGLFPCSHKSLIQFARSVGIDCPPLSPPNHHHPTP